MKKILCRFFTLLMAFCMIFSCLCASAFATESTDALPEVYEVNKEVSPQNTNGYLSGWGQAKANSLGQGSFSVWTDGEYSAGAGMTLKTESSGQTGAVYISVQKPDGSYFKNSVEFGANQEKKYQMFFASGGEYKVYYRSTVNAPVTITCWIYA